MYTLCIFGGQMSKKIKILEPEVIDTKLLRMAYEIIENNFDEKEIIIAGIQGRGFDIACVLNDKIKLISKIKTNVVTIRINKENPVECSLPDTIKFDGKSIIVVDDVANSGRTLLYALNPFLNIIAKKIQIAVLVDRKHKNYPICADYIGTSITTTLQEHISVEVKAGKVIGAFLV
jgi:pyrimidine operon attenuation protein / uracil phosphoribosyltransferase